MSTKTSGTTPSQWPSFVLAPAEATPEVTLHHLQSLAADVPLEARPVVIPAAKPAAKAAAPA